MPPSGCFSIVQGVGRRPEERGPGLPFAQGSIELHSSSIRSELPMPLTYAHTAIRDDQVPVAAEPLVQHALDTYASETNKVASVWGEFRDDDLAYRPHARASTVGDILKHQLLSERRFFGEFLGAPEPAAADVLPSPLIIASAIGRLCALAVPR